jgi:hypothetical protein
MVSATAAQVFLPVATMRQLLLLQLDIASRWLRAPSVVPAKATALPVVVSSAIASGAMAGAAANAPARIATPMMMDSPPITPLNSSAWSRTA